MPDAPPVGFQSFHGLPFQIGAADKSEEALAGHAVELTDIAGEKGWLDRYAMSDIRLTNSLTPDQVYGILFENVTIGVFHNIERLSIE